jgi:hypothetical protein
MTLASPGGPRAATILVTGDVVVDHHIYCGDLTSLSGGVGAARGTYQHTELGGAALIEALLDTTGDRQPEPWCVALGVRRDRSLHPHGFALWRPSRPGPRGNGSGWRVTQTLGYGVPRDAAPPAALSAFPCPEGDPAAPAEPDVVVVDDAAAGFRARESCWPPCLTGGRLPSWVVWRLAGDLHGGPLWERAAAAGVPPRTILLVSAADLRRAGLDINAGLSWERTALDTERVLRDANHAPLAASRHVVVSFHGAGILWADRAERGTPRCTLVYDPQQVARDAAPPADGDAFGYQACLAAGIAWGLARAGSRVGDLDAERSALDDGLSRGMRARRLLFELGHDALDDALPSGFPARRIRADALLVRAPAQPRAELPRVEEPGWAILADVAREAGLSGPLYQQARLVALHGHQALRGMPMLQAGTFVTVDRTEIEALARIQGRVVEYQRSARGSKPLSFAVFGPPGTGKSFLVRQIAASVGMGKPLEFNLAQFSDERDLIGAFHQVRDRALTGELPFVFWDEFDAQELRWLRLLLAPMQDGYFLEGQVQHPLGKCVFAFAGATSWRADEFGPWHDPDSRAARDEERIWRITKGQDFSSRLSGTLDVLGPNPRLQRRTVRGEDAVDDPSDVCFPIRRALFLRAARGLRPDDVLDLPQEWIEAFLRVPRYTHGARSFQRVLEGIRDGQLPNRSALDGDVDGEVDGVPALDWLPQFVRTRAARLAAAEKAQRALVATIEAQIDRFAAQIHAAYSALPAAERSPDVAAQFDVLDDFLKDSNRAAARRVPAALGAAGLLICRNDAPNALAREHAEAWLRRFLDLAAAEEHLGWCRFHEQRGWQHADIAGKDSARRLHPALTSWAALSEPNRDKDRLQVGVYLRIVHELGYAVSLA